MEGGSRAWAASEGPLKAGEDDGGLKKVRAKSRWKNTELMKDKSLSIHGNKQKQMHCRREQKEVIGFFEKWEDMDIAVWEKDVDRSAWLSAAFAKIPLLTPQKLF